MENNLVGKYLEISGEIAGQIVAEEKDTLIVRRAIVDKELIETYSDEVLESVISHILLTEKAVYLSKSYVGNYWVRIVDLPNIPVTVNVVDSVVLINKLFGM
ncbi:TPA: hypothetical protein VC336_001745 [Streptococcus pyogenes]|nr:hypothetical protein [Streptococcus pyogenes]